MASASQSTPSSASVPTVSQSSSSSSVVAAPAPAPTSSTPRPSSASASTPAVPTPAPAASTTPRSTSTSTSSHSSPSSSSSTHAAPAQTTVFVAPPESHGPSSVNVVAPIAAVAGILIIIYVAYRIYLLHKRRKDEKIPPPPPRMPAIFDRPQSVMMMTPGSAPPSYRQSMRPVSMLYNPDSYSSSSLPTKGALTSASGHSTPTQPGFPVADETGRQSPLPYPSHDQRSFRGGGMPPRPHSVASFTSNRYSSYGSPRTPYMNRVEVVLPQPLAPEASSALSSASARQSRFSTYHGPPNPDMRPRSMILPPLAITPEGDWTHRVTTTAEERASSSIDHSSPPPPPPPKDRPKSAILLSGTSSAATSRDHAMPGGYPSSPAARARSVSPPEPLLASGVFASSSSDSTSRQHSLDVGSDEAAKAAKPKV